MKKSQIARNLKNIHLFSEEQIRNEFKYCQETETELTTEIGRIDLGISRGKNKKKHLGPKVSQIRLYRNELANQLSKIRNLNK